MLIRAGMFLSIEDIVGSAVGHRVRGLPGAALLVRYLSAQQVAGLEWVRERIVRVYLTGESLIQRSHKSGPDKRTNACQRDVPVSAGTGRSVDAPLRLCALWRADAG
ncbi:hypothetical protein DPEC_G00065100 [Dallia pectoralis]|uniref:Uncharacterized protein n=1 Tax=Dallia pectoralis TaxID=75939 RepID=A0ACC2H895_DALPE|nr:hypothetical protein DPEC_G00065100 [Dallia pectoralis]